MCQIVGYTYRECRDTHFYRRLICRPAREKKPYAGSCGFDRKDLIIIHVDKLCPYCHRWEEYQVLSAQKVKAVAKINDLTEKISREVLRANRRLRHKQHKKSKEVSLSFKIEALPAKWGDLDPEEDEHQMYKKDWTYAEDSQLVRELRASLADVRYEVELIDELILSANIENAPQLREGSELYHSVAPIGEPSGPVLGKSPLRWSEHADGTHLMNKKCCITFAGRPTLSNLAGRKDETFTIVRRANEEFHLKVWNCSGIIPRWKISSSCDGTDHVEQNEQTRINSGILEATHREASHLQLRNIQYADQIASDPVNVIADKSLPRINFQPNATVNTDSEMQRFEIARAKTTNNCNSTSVDKDGSADSDASSTDQSLNVGSDDDSTPDTSFETVRPLASRELNHADNVDIRCPLVKLRRANLSKAIVKPASNQSPYLGKHDFNHGTNSKEECKSAEEIAGDYQVNLPEKLVINTEILYIHQQHLTDNSHTSVETLKKNKICEVLPIDDENSETIVPKSEASSYGTIERSMADTPLTTSKLPFSVKNIGQESSENWLESSSEDSSSVKPCKSVYHQGRTDALIPTTLPPSVSAADEPIFGSTLPVHSEPEGSLINELRSESKSNTAKPSLLPLHKTNSETAQDSPPVRFENNASISSSPDRVHFGSTFTLPAPPSPPIDSVLDSTEVACESITERSIKLEPRPQADLACKELPLDLNDHETPSLDLYDEPEPESSRDTLSNVAVLPQLRGGMDHSEGDIFSAPNHPSLLCNEESSEIVGLNVALLSHVVHNGEDCEATNHNVALFTRRISTEQSHLEDMFNASLLPQFLSNDRAFDECGKFPIEYEPEIAGYDAAPLTPSTRKSNWTDDCIVASEITENTEISKNHVDGLLPISGHSTRNSGIRDLRVTAVHPADIILDDTLELRRRLWHDHSEPISEWLATSQSQDLYRPLFIAGDNGNGERPTAKVPAEVAEAHVRKVSASSTDTVHTATTGLSFGSSTSSSTDNTNITMDSLKRPQTPPQRRFLAVEPITPVKRASHKRLRGWINGTFAGKAKKIGFTNLPTCANVTVRSSPAENVAATALSKVLTASRQAQSSVALEKTDNQPSRPPYRSQSSSVHIQRKSISCAPLPLWSVGNGGIVLTKPVLLQATEIHRRSVLNNQGNQLQRHQLIAGKDKDARDSRGEGGAAVPAHLSPTATSINVRPSPWPRQKAKQLEPDGERKGFTLVSSLLQCIRSHPALLPSPGRPLYVPIEYSIKDCLLIMLKRCAYGRVKRVYKAWQRIRALFAATSFALRKNVRVLSSFTAAVLAASLRHVLGIGVD